ncbi:paeninodin family lasso peptide [Alkalihalobacillus sp. LMS39]|uniref:paeninodin family lasso peptide n=1 Tax=Alkalihalobacillus sp. LMS39 TaxID=2924032 RepID=UPI001FB24C87|nr:paeninodin family lasso peptide [Alkalihalobacillus sp. LMS39]UOE95447.1 paeninodin family lasso peptide [Alkalihalobacillus sp. LMS39]
MKKTWNQPKLETLQVSMTFNGPGNANADCFDVSDGRTETHPGRSNASCLDNGGNPLDS